MSLITCCPACATMFKVVPDQLRISEGWVRCGHCAEVFDATAHLQDPNAPAVPAVPVRQQVDEPAASPPYPPFVLAQADDYETQVVDAAAEHRLESGDADADPGPELPLEDPKPQPDTNHAAVQDVSFVRQARRKAFWRRPAVRAALALLVLVMAALLTLQYAVHERDRIAAFQPALRPLIQAVCEPLRCSIGSPRQIEAIVIDSSSFSRLRSDAYRLAFTLKNQAPTEVAMPAVELTLTDTQDQPVLRRVLTPADMGGGVIAPASDWSGTLAMSVANGAGAGRIAGYRLLAFYP